MWTLICLLYFIGCALCQIIASIILSSCICRSLSEELEITCIDDDNNRSILRRCISIKNYTALWWGAGPHAQTLLSRYLREEHKMDYKREMVQLSDRVEIALDWKAEPYLPGDAPLIFICHGVGGDSSSNYLKTFTSFAAKLGFRTVAYNRRGHGGTSLLPKGFDQGTDLESGQRRAQRTRCQLFPRHYDPLDMEEAIKHCQFRYPDAPIFGLGFSAGGNLVARYHSSLGPDSPFVSAVSMAHGYDIHQGISTVREKHPYILNGIICSLYRGIAETNAKDIERLAKAQEQTIDLKSILATADFMTVDIKAVVEPSPSQFGYKTIKEYYDDASCAFHLQTTAKPLLCLASKDDPLVYPWLLSIPQKAAQTNPNIIFATTARGGHLGWLENGEGWFGMRPWLPRVACEYFKACLANQKDKSLKAATVKTFNDESHPEIIPLDK